MKKTLYLIIFFVTTLLVFVALLGNAIYASPQDRLKKSYKLSHQPGDGDPYSINAEAKDLFDTQIDVGGTISNIHQSNDGISANDIANAESIFVKTTRYIMKIAVILSIPILFFVGIKIVLSLGNEGKMQESLKQAGTIIAGLFLALFSVMIVYLILSLTKSNISLF